MRHRPAQALENMVMVAIAETFQPETWESFVDDLCDRKPEDLRRLGRTNPGKTRERLVRRIAALETKMSRARELFIDGDLPRLAYEEKKSLIRDEIEMVQEELTKVDDLDDEMRRVDDLRKTLLSIENSLSGHYVFLIDEDNADAIRESKDSLPHGLKYGSEETAAWRRQEFYRRVGLKVKVGEELEISLGIGEPVSTLRTAWQAVLDQPPIDSPWLHPGHSPCRVGHREVLGVPVAGTRRLLTWLYPQVTL